MLEEQILSGDFKGRPLARLLRLAWLERRLFVRALAFLFVATAMELVFPRVLKILVDSSLVPQLSTTASPKMVWSVSQVAMALVVILILRSYAQFKNGWEGQRFALRVMERLRAQLYTALPALEVKFFDRTPSGRLLTRLTTNVNDVQDFFSTGLLTLLKDVSILIGAVVMLYTLSPVLAALQIGAVITLILISQLFGNVVRKTLREVNRLAAALSAKMKDIAEAHTAIKGFGAEERFQRSLLKLNSEERDVAITGVRWSAIYQPLMAAGGYVGTGVILIYGAPLVHDGTLTLGSLIAALAYSDLLFGPVRDLGEKYLLLIGALSSAERVYQIIDSPPDSKDGTSEVSIESPLPLTVRDLHFGYDENSPVLNGISFDLHQSEMLGIVGPTGSGKSSILQVLLGFYRGYIGEVKIGSSDLSALTLSQQRSLFCYVSQQLIDPGEDLSRLIAGDEERSLWLLASGPLGPFDWRQLSSGQRQLLSLFASLQKEAPIVLLDEVTSVMDHFLAERVVAYLRRKKTGMAVLLVTHRPSDAAGCDEIIVLSAGRVVERGRHTQLLTQGGMYAKLLSLEKETENF